MILYWYDDEQHLLCMLMLLHIPLIVQLLTPVIYLIFEIMIDHEQELLLDCICNLMFKRIINLLTPKSVLYNDYKKPTFLRTINYYINNNFFTNQNIKYKKYTI